MRKNNIDSLLTLDFVRMSVAQFLLFASLYALLPLLPLVLKRQMELPFSSGVWLYAAFVAGVLLVGPFHAHLGDAFKRKHVFVLSALVSSASAVGYMLASEWVQLLLLALVQGGSFALAVVGSLTVAIDITPSTRRSAGNMIYAWMARMGVMVGAWGGAWVYTLYGFPTLVYIAAALGMVSLYLGERVYVPFRAPIGIPVCTLDRFLLPRAWVPALGVFLLGGVAGRLMPLLMTGDECPLFVLGLLAVLCVPLTRLFVRLSHHCQRGTANSTCYIATDAGVLLGLSLAYLDPDPMRIHRSALAWGVFALLFALFAVYPYYKTKRVR